MHTQRYACRYNWRSGQRRVLSTCCSQLDWLSHRPLPLLPLCHVGQGVLCQEPVARLSDGKELGTVRLNRCSANAGFLRGKSVAGQGYHDLRIYCARSTQCFPDVSSATGPRHPPSTSLTPQCRKPHHRQPEASLLPHPRSAHLRHIRDQRRQRCHPAIEPNHCRTKQ